MKAQDIIFLVSLFPLWYLREKRFFVWAALACLVVAILLFHYWVFFTAQRLTWYAAAFMAIEVIRLMVLLRKAKV